MTWPGSGQRTVLLDRDGVLNVDVPQSVTSLDELVVIPGARDALRRLRTAGFAVVVVTNQSCVGRGWLSWEALQVINKELNFQLGFAVRDWFVCPHKPEDGCHCRKPAVGLLERAQRTWGFDRATTWFVVDAPRDVVAAERFGCRPAIVRTGKGEETANEFPEVPAFVDLASFVGALLGEGGVPGAV